MTLATPALVLPAYLAAVEQAFLQAAGRGVLLSARDEALVRRWARAEYPLPVVVGAITECLARPGRRPRSLAWTAPAVEEAVQRWQRHAAERNPFDATPEPESGPDWPALARAFAELLGRLEEVGQACTEPTLRGVLRDAWLGVRALRDRCAREPELDPVAGLHKLERALEAGVMAVLPPEDRIRLEAEVDRALAVERRRADPAVFAELRSAWRWHTVRRHLALPALALRHGPALLDAAPALNPDVRRTASTERREAKERRS